MTVYASERWETSGQVYRKTLRVTEDAPPTGVAPLRWVLLTSVPVTCAEDADRILAWYRLRWRIEDGHRLRKTGCRAEYPGHRTRERLTRTLTIPAVIAWRLPPPGPPLPLKVQICGIWRGTGVGRSRLRWAPWSSFGPAWAATWCGTTTRRPAPPMLWEGFTALAQRPDAYETLAESQRLPVDWLVR